MVGTLYIAPLSRQISNTMRYTHPTDTNTIGLIYSFKTLMDS